MHHYIISVADELGKVPRRIASTTRNAYWKGTVGHLLDQLLAFGGYSQDMRSRCLKAFSSAFIPIMGPLPSEFTEHMQPCSSMVDDHTAVELSIVAGSSGEAPIRIYAEPLSPIDGTPAPQSTWLSCLRRLGDSLQLENGDLSWSEVCIRTLTTSTDNTRSTAQDTPPMAQCQFIFGELCNRLNDRLSHSQSTGRYGNRLQGSSQHQRVLLSRPAGSAYRRTPNAHDLRLHVGPWSRR
jgi:hypothetical protein